jgi:hypothetical protein
MISHKSRIHLMLAACFLSGCAGPRTARETAAALARQTTELKSQTEQFAAKRTDLIRMRTAALNGLEESAVESETDSAFRLQVWALTGDTESVKLANALIAQGDLAGKNKEAADAAKQQAGDVVQAAKSAFDARSANLAEVQKDLETLAEQPSLKDELAFLAGFVSEVRSDIKMTQTNAVKQTEAAKTAATAKAGNPPKSP